MLAIPSYLVHTWGGAFPRRYLLRRRDPAPGRGRLKAKHALKVPLTVYDSPDHVPPSTSGSTAAYRSRRCHQYADALYQNMPAAQKKYWRDARKKAGISAYDLWMKEALTLLNQGKRPPDYPSISGGWSAGKVIEGTTWPQAPCFGGPRAIYHSMVPIYDEGTQPPEILEWHFHLEYDGSPPPGDEGSQILFHAIWEWQWGDWRHYGETSPTTHDLYFDNPWWSEPYVIWTYEFRQDGQAYDYHGALKGPGTWYADCPEQRPWNPPPAYTWP